MNITFWGAARTVTGSCYLVEHQGVRFLVDCGMFQGSKALKERNYAPFPFPVSSIDFVLLTHAHIDHSGMLPKLYKQGYHNPIYTSTATAALAKIMLPDSGYIQEMEIERKNRKRARAGEEPLEPIYTAAEAAETVALFKPVTYDQEFAPAEGLRVVLHDAGHIMGSAMLEIFYEEDGFRRKLVFTGDLGRNDQAIIQDPYHIDGADHLVMESTYGNRVHGGGMEAEMPHFLSVITSTFAQGGNVIIPAFAVDRTQDILFMINELQREGKLPACKIYVDSPLAIQATNIFASFPDYFDRMTTRLFRLEGRPPFVPENLVCTASAAESMQLNNIKSGAIIISASGMADAGRIKHHLKHNLWRSECAVMFFGYQAEGTLGRRLVDGETKVTIHGEEIDVKAQIHNMEGFSAHADKNEMLDWLGHFRHLPEHIFITHGEESASLSFAQLLEEKLQVKTDVPAMGQSFNLLAEEAVAVTAGKPQEDTRAKMLAELNAVTAKLAGDSDALRRLLEYAHRLEK